MNLIELIRRLEQVRQLIGSGQDPDPEVLIAAPDKRHQIQRLTLTVAEAQLAVVLEGK